MFSRGNRSRPYFVDMAVFRLLIIIVLLLPQFGRAAGEPLIAWQVVAGEQAQLTVLGSVHMAFPDVYPLRKDLESAFNKADSLVVEVDITGEGARFGMVAILSANGQGSSQANRAMYQRRRWT